MSEKEKRGIDEFLSTVERLLKIILGIALFPLGIYFFIQWKNKNDTGDFHTPVPDDTPLINGEITSTNKDPVKTTTTDKKTKDAVNKATKIKSLIFLFLLPSILWSNNLEKKYKEIHSNISNGILSIEEKNNLSTRYTIISTEQPTKIIYPKYGITIHNDKTYTITNLQPKFIIEYDMGTNGLDSLIIDTIPIIEIKYTNELTNLDTILQGYRKKYNIYFGISLMYQDLKLINYTLLGYKFFEWKGLSVIPTLGFNLLSTNHMFDIFPVVNYNIKNYVDVGLTISLLQFNYGITLGLTF